MRKKDIHFLLDLVSAERDTLLNSCCLIDEKGKPDLKTMTHMMPRAAAEAALSLLAHYDKALKLLKEERDAISGR